MQKFGIGMPYESITQKKTPIQQPTSDKLTPEDEKAFLEGFNKYREEDKAEQGNLQKARQAYVDMQNQTPKDTLRRIANGIGVQNPSAMGTYVGSTIKNGDLTPEDERAFLEGFNQYREDVEQPQVKEQEKPKSNKILDGASTALAAASLIPGLDTFTNLASIPVDLMRGDYISAGLDLLGVIPFVGEIADVAKTARTADRIIDGVRTADKVVDGVRVADKAVDALEAVDDVNDAVRAIDDAEDFYDIGKKVELPDIKYPGDDPSIAPGKDFEWRGKSPPSEGLGAWYNPLTNESMHWDLNHVDPVGPHWDYIDAYGNGFRIYKDGRIELSKRGGKKK